MKTHHPKRNDRQTCGLSKYIACALLAVCTLLTAQAQSLLTYHVVGDVKLYVQGKATPLTMNRQLTMQSEVSIPYGGKLELLDEKQAKRIILKAPGRGTVEKLARQSNNTVASLSASYVGYVKKQMTNKGLTSKQRYTDFATVTRAIDSVADPKQQSPAQSARQNPLASRFGQFKKQQKQQFESFRDKCNRQYAEFVRKAWEKFGAEPPVPRPQEPKVAPVVCHDTTKTDRFLFFGKKKQREARTVEYNPDQLALRSAGAGPVETIKEVRLNDDERAFMDFPFEFYGTDMRVRLDENLRINLGEITPDRVADALLHFSSKAYDNLLYDCLALRKEHKLCDWAYLLMLQQLASQFCGEGTNEAALLMGHLYCQSGYKVRYACDAERLYVLVSSNHMIFDKASYYVDGERYYPVDAVDSELNVCRAAYPKEQTLSLFIPDAPVLQMPADSTTGVRTITSHRYPDFSIQVKVNPNLINFYDTYPSSFYNGEFTSRWVMYANTPMDADIRSQVYPSLKRQLEGLTEWEKVNHLLDLVQTGLQYEYDDNVWGCDRAFFAEESLYYTFCDCEDRAILFTRLVRDLVGLDCVLVYYPGHLASAVHFTEQPGGSFYTHADKNYTVCDPTYIHASVGMEMPEWDKADVTLIPLQ